ncbi:flowering locus K homology domain-like [Iris pallida]|uniref:Secretory carrier-associated membrane protein n=1 Tax=Iris pallida TaxID=29817 RepID=A0AAX6FUE4_IRIPA|nr:flowering locus K homology domain-like [Iris pallida]
MHSVFASVLMTSMLSFTRGGYGCLSDAGIIIEEKNWPSFSPIIHHDIAGEIPIHLQRLLYFAFASLLGSLGRPRQQFKSSSSTKIEELVGRTSMPRASHFIGNGFSKGGA